MDNVALIDADSLIWAAAYGRETEEEIKEYLDFKMNLILSETRCNYYRLFVGGKNNFRYIIRSDYKANRTDRELPPMFGFTKQYVINELDAYVSNGVETDDTINATAIAMKDKYFPVICTIDKDYKIKPRTIYNWERKVKDKIFPAKLFTVSEEEAMYNFFVMMITGDAGDGIHTCKGIGDVKAKAMMKDKNKYSMLKTLVLLYKKFYGSARWRQKMVEVYHLLNLIDTGIDVPRRFNFKL